MMTEFGEYLGGGNFTEAEKTLKIVLTHISQNSRVSKDDKKIASALQKQFQGLSSEDKKMFMQDLQRYSSGSEASRKLGKSIRNNSNALSSDLKKAMDQVERLYNDGLARAFGEIYGVEKEVIMSQFKGMRNSLETNSLQSIAEGGLAIVSYSQL